MNPDNTNNNEEELGRLLREEVPEPGESFWANVDTRLTAVSAKRADDEPEIARAAESPDTSEQLITLTDTASPATTRNTRMRLAAAVALIALVGVGAVLALRDPEPSSVDVAGDTSANEGQLAEGRDIELAPGEQLVWTSVGADIDGPPLQRGNGTELAFSADGTTVAVQIIEQVGEGEFAPIFGVSTRVFRWDEVQWDQLGPDIAGLETEDPLFPSVALSNDGNTIVLGEGGTVRVLTWDGDAWNQMGTFIERLCCGVGWQSLAISADGSTVVVGDSQFNVDEANRIRGFARVFRWDGSEWAQVGADLVDEGGRFFGESVAVSTDGNTVAVGDPMLLHEGEDLGGAAVFRWDGTTWAQLGDNILSENASGSWFGDVVALSADGETVAIGGPLSSANGEGGHVRVLRWDGNAWVQLGAEISPENPLGEPGLFGFSVALSADGNTLVASSSGRQVTGADTGTALVFTWDGAQWRQLGDEIFVEGFDLREPVGISADGSTVMVNAQIRNESPSVVRVLQLESGVPTPRSPIIEPEQGPEDEATEDDN